MLYLFTFFQKVLLCESVCVRLSVRRCNVCKYAIVCCWHFSLFTHPLPYTVNTFLVGRFDWVFLSAICIMRFGYCSMLLSLCFFFSFVGFHVMCVYDVKPLWNHVCTNRNEKKAIYTLFIENYFLSHFLHFSLPLLQLFKM
jgi:hypothetical protein